MPIKQVTWSHFMVTLPGHISRPPFTVTFHGHISRSHFTATFHGHSSRPPFMVTFHSHISRSHFTVTFHGHISRSHFMDTFHDHISWTYFSVTYNDHTNDPLIVFIPHQVFYRTNARVDAKVSEKRLSIIDAKKPLATEENQAPTGRNTSRIWKKNL